MQTKCFWSSSFLSGVLIRTPQPTTIPHVAIAPRVRATRDKNFPGASGVPTEEERGGSQEAALQILLRPGSICVSHTLNDLWICPGPGLRDVTEAAGSLRDSLGPDYRARSSDVCH